jgi:2-polyprenyl-6-methoxyphenol hydroxylase-like FAD-dependent oxidoreductase
MRIVEHRSPGTHRLLHIEADGCVVNVTIDLHDLSGRRFTSVEVVPAEPDDDGAVWSLTGPATIVVRRDGRQVLAGDAAHGTAHETAHGTTTAHPHHQLELS